MTYQTNVLAGQDSLDLRPLEFKTISELFDLIDRNRTHLQSWWDESAPLCRNVEELSSHLYTRRAARRLYFGIWRGQVLIGFLGMTPAFIESSVAWLSFWITSEECGKGFGREVVRRFSEHAFGMLAMDMLLAYVKLDNAPSIAALTRSGFEIEGTYDDSLLFKKSKNTAAER